MCEARHIEAGTRRAVTRRPQSPRPSGTVASPCHRCHILPEQPMDPTAADVERLRLELGPLTFDARAVGPTDGEPVLLLHGFPQTSSCWGRVLPHLGAAGFRAVAPDQRGYSPDARPADATAYGMDLLVGDVVGLADTLGWGTFHLVGHDWGGAVAWQVAGRHPERLRSLSVVSTPHPVAFTKAKKAGPSADGDDQNERSSYVATFRDPATPAMLMADDRAVLKLLLEGSGMDDDGPWCSTGCRPSRTLTPRSAWYRAADPADATGMGPVTTPTLYVWSTEDIALGRAAAELTAAEVDGPYRFEVLEGVSHWVPEEAADDLAALLVDHIGSSPPEPLVFWQPWSPVGGARTARTGGVWRWRTLERVLGIVGRTARAGSRPEGTRGRHADRSSDPVGDRRRPGASRRSSSIRPKAGEVLVEMVASGMCHSDDHARTGDLPARHAADRRPRGRRHRDGGRRGRHPGRARRPRRVQLRARPAATASPAPTATRTCATTAPPCSSACSSTAPAATTPRRPGRLHDGLPRHLRPAHGGQRDVLREDRGRHPPGAGLPGRLRRHHRLGLVGLRRRGAPGRQRRGHRRRRHRRRCGPGRPPGRSRATSSPSTPSSTSASRPCSFGATHTANSIGEAFELIQQVTWGRMCDKVICCVGVGDGEQIALDHDAVRQARPRRGHQHPPGDREPGQPLARATSPSWRSSWSARSSARPTRSPTSPACMHLYRNGQLDLAGMVTREYELSEINQGFDDMLAGRNIRGVIRYS